MKWCTINDLDYEKCSWLSVAMELQGVKPRINCIEEKSVTSCLEKIKEDEADVMVLDSHYGFMARK